MLRRPIRFGSRVLAGSAGGAGGAFLAQAMALPGLQRVLTVPDGTVASDIAPDGTIMTDASETSARTIVAKIASTGDWAFLEEGPGTGLLGRCITTKTNRGANYLIMDADPGVVTKSAMILLQVETPQVAGQSINIGMTGQWGTAVADGYLFLWRDTNLHHFSGGLGTGLVHGDEAGWVTLAYRATDDSPGEGGYYLSSVGSPFGGIGEVVLAPPNNFTSAWHRKGFAAFYGFSLGGPGAAETSNGTVKIAAVVQYGDELTEADLEALHDSVAA